MNRECAMKSVRRSWKILFSLLTLCFVTEVVAQEGVERKRPGSDRMIVEEPILTYDDIPTIEELLKHSEIVESRWDMFYKGKWYDPYNQNVLKGDVPIFGGPGHEWFLETELLSLSEMGRQKIILPVGLQSVKEPDRINTLGNGHVNELRTTLFTSFSLIRGNTAFKPPEFELRVAPAFNYNYARAGETGVLRIDPSRGHTRDDEHIGFQELFVDVHLANLSDRYDFVSSRVGIQEFRSDFRGFIFDDQAPGVRLFGNFDDNRWQANLAWFSRLDKDTNSGLNTFDTRYEDVFLLNVYRQDVPVLGHQIQGSLIYRQDRAGDHGIHFDENGFLRRPTAFGDERPKNIYSTYVGLNTDGHIGRWNTTGAFYYVFGSESHNQIPSRGTDISAAMVAQEISYDFDWLRLRGSFLWASGDSDPFDDDATGFDAIFDIPNFAGGPFSFWQRQAIPLVAGGEVFLVNQESFLPNLRGNKTEGQSNFVNPGIQVFNVGADVDLTPKLRLILNGSYLQFDTTAVLQTLRQNASIDQGIGFDLATGIEYRPFLNNNVEIIAGTAMLLPDDGLKQLFGNEKMYQFFTALILEY